MTASSVDTTRGSNTTVQCGRARLRRTEHAGGAQHRVVHASLGTRSPGPRPTVNPLPVWVSSASPAMASTARKAVVRLRYDEMPVVEASATSTRLSE